MNEEKIMENKITAELEKQKKKLYSMFETTTKRERN